MEEDRIHLVKVARRNLTIQGVFIVISLAFLGMTMIYAVNTIVNQQSRRMATQMEAQSVARRELILKTNARHFVEIADGINKNRELLIQLDKDQKELTAVLHSHDTWIKRRAR